MKLITFAEISRPVSRLLLVFIYFTIVFKSRNLFWYKVIRQLKIITENGYLDFYERFLSMLDKLTR